MEPTAASAQIMQQLQNVIVEQQQRLAHLERAMVSSATAPRVATSMAKPPKPDMFDGRSLKSIDQWLFVMEQYFTITSTGNDLWVNICSSYLRGSAATWWRKFYQDAEKNKQEITWTSFKTSLLQRFKPIEAPKTARTALDSLKQTRSVSEYCDVFLRLIQLIDDMSSAEQLHCFIRGLRANVGREVDMFQPKTLEDAMSIATRADLRFKTFSTPSRDFSSFNRSSGERRNFNHALSSQSSAVPMELGVMEDVLSSMENAEVNAAFAPGNQRRMTNDLNRDEYDRLSREKKCFRCRMVGHYARNCTNRSVSNGNNNHGPLKY